MDFCELSKTAARLLLHLFKGTSGRVLVNLSSLIPESRQRLFGSDACLNIVLWVEVMWRKTSFTGYFHCCAAAFPPWCYFKCDLLKFAFQVLLWKRRWLRDSSLCLLNMAFPSEGPEIQFGTECSVCCSVGRHGCVPVWLVPAKINPRACLRYGQKSPCMGVRIWRRNPDERVCVIHVN